METKAAWWSKLNWLGLLTVAIGIIQLVADSDITPADVDKFLLIVIGSLTIILRTFFTVNPVKVGAILLAALLCFPAGPLMAQGVLDIDTAAAANGDHYLKVTIENGKIVGVVPLSQAWKVKLGQTNPGPVPQPNPTPQSPAFATSKLLAQQALAKPGATKQTGAGLSAVYSAVSREINTGGLDPKLATTAIALGVNEVYKGATPEDKAAWSVYSTSIAMALTDKSVQGELATTGKWVVILNDFHEGIDAATGIPIEVTSLSATSPNNAGILDGIDFKKLIELILEIIKLINTLKGL